MFINSLFAAATLLGLFLFTGGVTGQQEVFGFFSGANWVYFDFETITTVCVTSVNMAEFESGGAYDGLIPKAHEHGVRVVVFANAVCNNTEPSCLPLGERPSARAKWVHAAVKLVEKFKIDGINFDYEEPLNATDPRVDAYTRLVNETRLALLQNYRSRSGKIDSQRSLPQISVDVAWSPDGIDGRFYDAVGLSEAAAYLYIMAYDVASQYGHNGAGECVAKSNSPFDRVQMGVEHWVHTIKDPHKLILGLPWYGFLYPCVGSKKAGESNCVIKSVPFRGSPCSDAAGGEQAYTSIMSLLHQSGSSVERDPVSKSPFFYFTDEGSEHQLWFDDPTSLADKLALVKEYELGGAGPYEFSDLDYNQSSPIARLETEKMWKVLRNLKKGTF